jgi:hypothetical protein
MKKDVSTMSQCELFFEIEQLRAQLAACCNAAVGNTREALAENRRVKKGDYSWSLSYEDVLNAVEREIKQQELAEHWQERAKDWRERAEKAERELAELRRKMGLDDSGAAR